ncbi:hypothetical protein SAMN06297387_109182 [Streptomyces zhaozhouensis]|uniref:SPFH domain / Band 7 family protein n=1 Tax=Streptomyces zhaozhouensis TaxID=1300267 RepID=A0A286DX43_9ACTN|nr:hypothetical protein [Streptomyces zhaozhouensis]SOD63239.1 hypothetical protein SAMN06297387_109182 [Streptomyces zhaozhouensis]
MSDREPGAFGGPGREDGDGDGDERGERVTPAGPLLRECRVPYRQTSGQVIAVLRYRNGGHSVWWPDRHEDHAKPLLRGPYTVFEVATGRHVSRFDLTLPAAGDSEFFEAEAAVHWEVRDPHLVVERQVWNVADLLADELQEHLRGISRRFELTQAERVDRAVRDELLSGRIAFGDELGLRAKVHIFVDLSYRAVDQRRQHSELEQEMRVSHRREEWESRRIASRAREFEQMLQRGDIAQIAWFMASEPGRELEIRNLIRQERREDHQVSIELFSRMLDSGHLERHDIGEHMYEVIQYLRDRSDDVVGNTMDRVLTARGGRRELGRGEGGSGRRRPFWEDGDGDAAGGGDRGAEGGRADASGPRAGGVREDEWEPWDGEPGDGPGRAPDRISRFAGRGDRDGGRASDTFDDWDAP